MKRFISITEHLMTDQKYNDLIKNGFEPTEFITSITEIGRAHVRTPVTLESRMPSSA